MHPTTKDIWALARYLADYVERAERLTHELAETQEQLHEAQAELGRRADRIAEMEGEDVPELAACPDP